ASADLPVIAGYHIVTTSSRLRRESFSRIALLPTGCRPFGCGSSNTAEPASEAWQDKGRKEKTSASKARIADLWIMALLTAGEVMEVVHDGAAQMAEHEPEDCLENFLGCG